MDRGAAGGGNAQATRLWFDANALEAYFGPGDATMVKRLVAQLEPAKAAWIGQACYDLGQAGIPLGAVYDCLHEQVERITPAAAGTTNPTARSGT